MNATLTDAETALGGALPHRRDEAWKWTDVRAAAKADAAGLSAPLAPEFRLPKGLSVTRTKNMVSDQPMASLAARFAGESYTIKVPAGFRSSEALHIDYKGAGHARVQIKLGKNAHLFLTESHEDAKGGFANIDINIDVAEGAELTRHIYQSGAGNTARIATANISLWGGASLTQYALSFGGGLTRLETRLAVLGKDTKTLMNGAYLLSGSHHTDMTSYVDIGAVDAHIRQTVKGVVTDKARGVFQGKFHVRRPAQHTDAEMRHDALMLSDTSQVRAKPELEIYADDVACAHGNTLGALDESALFYMRQRGIPAAQARALLTEAFIAEAFDGMEEAARDSFVNEVRTWLEAHA